VSALLKRANGELWGGAAGSPGTAGGVRRFDGTRFVPIPGAEALEGRIIVTMLEDQQQRVWIATFRDGLFRLDGERLTAFGVDEGLPSPSVFALHEDRQGRLWIGTQQGLVRYDGSRIHPVVGVEALAHPIISIAEEASGTLWI